jgi:hypothetical protein
MSKSGLSLESLPPPRRELLLRRLKQKADIAHESGLRPQSVVPGPRDGPIPLSSVQQRLWFLDQLTPHNPFYNTGSTIRLAGCLDAGALERTFNELIRRHEILRTTFASTEGQPAQVIAPALEIAIPLVDLRHVPQTQRETERLAVAAAQQPFDLAQGPLLRATLIRRGDQDHVLVLVTHHIIIDGWSIGVFTRELGMIYAAFSSGQPSPLAELPIQYADYAIWQR